MTEAARPPLSAAADREALIAELAASLDKCATKLERCIVRGGTDAKFAVIAVSEYRSLIAKALTS